MSSLVPINKDDPEKIKELEAVRKIIRPEVNIEKHADFIFAPSHSKRIREPRKRIWVTNLEDGTKVSSYLLIEPIYGGKTPTTRTRKVYLALQKLWEEHKRDDDTVVFSARELAENLGIQWAGKKTAKELLEELQALRATMFTWKHSFLDADGHKVNLLDHVNILDRLTYVSIEDRQKPSDQFLARHVVKFSEPILANLKANRTKPTNIDVVLSLKGELASVLYARLDILLAGRDRYERTSKGVFEDLQLAGEPEYRYPAGRKRKLDRIVAELNGKQISTGILKLFITKTNDDSDWKLIATKETLVIEGQSHHPRFTKKKAPVNSPDIIQLLVEDITKALKGIQGKERLFQTFARHYSSELLYQAISEYKADVIDAKNPSQVFTAIVHRLAHKKKLEWIKPCPADCKYR